MFEPVHTVDDYYDGPLSGIAEYNGRLYYFGGPELDTKAGKSTTFSFSRRLTLKH
jgi:hypothetical protein